MTEYQSLPCALVIFGASGDLTRRKLMPAIYDLATGGFLPATFSIIGYSRSAMSNEQFLASIEEGLVAAERDVADPAWGAFRSHIQYVSGGYDDPAGLNRLAEALCQDHCGAALYYLALPPSASRWVLEAMPKSKLPLGDSARILMEKPFGTDLSSAQKLNASIGAEFSEKQVYRIDHYLAKDTVRNLLVFRFGNAIFEPLWNRNYIDHVQITAAESLGIEGRGGYYEEAGVVRDMLQNHVLQLLALMAMEPPVAGDEESVRDKKVDVFKSLAPLTRDDFVFGQYDGYRQEEKVAADSQTPTFAAAKLTINNWRWQGVPFFLRSGKSLAQKVTEIAVQFKHIPLCMFGDASVCERLENNVLIIRIQPDEGINLRFNLQVPGPGNEIAPANLDFSYHEIGARPGEAYARVILDAIHARPALFWRNDGVEAAWRFADPMLAAMTDAREIYPNYARGSWGPARADELIRGSGFVWRND